MKHQIEGKIVEIWKPPLDERLKFRWVEVNFKWNFKIPFSLKYLEITLVKIPKSWKVKKGDKVILTIIPKRKNK
ncbi:MAG: hypothetical protein AABY22_21080 [Nanoarchaeota archaeon]